MDRLYTKCAIINIMIELKKVLGKKIKEAREEKGVTQKELGAELGYSPMGISHFENGIREIKMTDIQKMAAFFNKNISYFLTPDTTMFRAEHSNNEEVEQSLKNFDSFLEKEGYK